MATPIVVPGSMPTMVYFNLTGEDAIYLFISILGIKYIVTIEDAEVDGEMELQEKNANYL